MLLVVKKQVSLMYNVAIMFYVSNVAYEGTIVIRLPLFICPIKPYGHHKWRSPIQDPPLLFSLKSRYQRASQPDSAMEPSHHNMIDLILTAVM